MNELFVKSGGQDSPTRVEKGYLAVGPVVVVVVVVVGVVEGSRKEKMRNVEEKERLGELKLEEKTCHMVFPKTLCVTFCYKNFVSMRKSVVKQNIR